MIRRTPKERPNAALRGYKLGNPMISADGTRAGFSGVTIGRSSVYGVTADAECNQGGRHRSPCRWCDCGFYCLHTLDDARALACDPDYCYAVLLEVAASGRFMRYERGLRYARQRITRVRVGRCGCGYEASVLAETGASSVGWRRLVALCHGCAGSRPNRTLAEFAWLLDGAPVVNDRTTRPYDPVRPFDLSTAAPGETAGVRPDEADRVSLLSAEVALLQARLDEVQRQLTGLTGTADG